MVSLLCNPGRQLEGRDPPLSIIVVFAWEASKPAESNTSLTFPEYRAKPAELISGKQAEVLSVRFPKEYDHINLAAKHPNVCMYKCHSMLCLFVIFHSHIHTYMHASTHTCTCIDSLNFFPKRERERYTYIYICIFICIYTMNIHKYIYMYVPNGHTYIYICIYIFIYLPGKRVWSPQCS